MTLFNSRDTLPRRWMLHFHFQVSLSFYFRKENWEKSNQGKKVVMAGVGETLFVTLITDRVCSTRESNVFMKARLHQTSALMQSQRCDDASDTAVIEKNGVAPKWVAAPFWHNYLFPFFSIEPCYKRHRNVDTALTLMLGVNGPQLSVILSTGWFLIP